MASSCAARRVVGQVRCETVAREVTAGCGHLSGQLRPIHFGLAATDGADLRVTWPDGEQGPWQRVTANQLVVARPGQDPAVAVE